MGQYKISDFYLFIKSGEVEEKSNQTCFLLYSRILKCINRLNIGMFLFIIDGIILWFPTPYNMTSSTPSSTPSSIVQICSFEWTLNRILLNPINYIKVDIVEYFIYYKVISKSRK